MKKRGSAWKLVFALLETLALLLEPFGYADVFMLPSGATSVGDEAFLNCESITETVIPECVESVGESAYSGCRNLRDVTILSSETVIGENAFSDCAPALWMHCPPGSAAVEYARMNHIDYDADTRYRALIVGQNYTGTELVLYGPTNDARAVRFCLTEMETAPWSVSQKTNLTADGILDAISGFFASADENDVSLFYYSGHGGTDGSLVGSDKRLVTPTALRAQLDGVPGRKVVVVDACYSGQLIDESQNTLLKAARPDFVSAFLSAFTLKTRGALNADGYFVAVAAGPREVSSEGKVTSGSSSKIMGFFSYFLCRGLGWNGVTSQACDWLADANGDGAVSLPEAVSYAGSSAKEYVPNQNAACWPGDSGWFAPFRR